MTNKIEITEQHKKLLKAMSRYLTLEREYGTVPEFDAKRPYGNRYYEGDIVRIIGKYIDGTNDTYEIFDEHIDLEEEEIPEHIYDKIIEIQQELPQVLKQILENL